MRRRHAILLGLLATAVAVTTAARADEPGVAVALDPPVLTVGDPVEASLEVVVAGDGSDVLFPDWSKGWGDAEVLEASEVERTLVGDGARLRQRVRLTAFRTGKVALPPIAIRLGRGASAPIMTPPDLVLDVRSVLPADEPEVAPLPAEPPRPLALPTAVIWTVAALAAAVVMAALMARRRARATPSDRVLTPLEELLDALSALAKDAPEPGHARLSSALRRYLGRALDFPAVESSTREVERALAARHLDPALVQRTARLLRESDLVKFGRRPAVPVDLARRAKEARAIGDAVETHLRPAPAAVQDAEAAA